MPGYATRIPAVVKCCRCGRQIVAANIADALYAADDARWWVDWDNDGDGRERTHVCPRCQGDPRGEGPGL